MALPSRRPSAVAVARELSEDAPLHALIGADSPIPDISLLSDDWTPFLPARGAVDQVGDPILIGSELVAGDYFEHPAEADTLNDDGGTPQSYRRGSGTVTLHPHSVPTFGAPWTDHHTLAFAKLLGSGCLVRDAVTTRSLTVDGSTNANTWTVADIPADVHVGQVITRDAGGRRYGSMIVGLDGDTDTIQQLLPFDAALEAADVVRVCQTFEFGKPKAGAALGPSVVLRQDGSGFRDYLYAARWAEMTWSMSERAVECAFTMDVDIVLDGSADAAVAANTNCDAIPYEPPGRRIYSYGGTMPRLSNGPSFDRQDATLVAPIMLGGVELDVDEVTIKVTNTLGVRGNFYGLGRGPREVDAVAVEITLLLSALPSGSSALRQMLWQAWSNSRTLSIPFGPVGAHGGCWIVPNAVLKTDVRKFDTGQDFYRVALTFGLGANITESGGGTSPLKLGLV